ncbi:MAG: hypothetical protein ACKVX7_05780 [Planctomycetota bacterium]
MAAHRLVVLFLCLGIVAVGARSDSFAQELFFTQDPPKPIDWDNVDQTAWSEIQKVLAKITADYRQQNSNGRKNGVEEQLYKDLDRAIQLALAKEFAADDAPASFIEQLRAVLRFADLVDPAQNPIFASAFFDRVPEKLRKLPADQLPQFREELLSLWRVAERIKGEASREGRNESDVTALRRQIVLQALPGLLHDAPDAERAQFVTAIAEMLTSERHWLRELKNEGKVGTGEAVSMLATQPESATLDPLLELLDHVMNEVYRSRDKTQINATLAPFVTEMVAILGRLEVRSQKKDDANDTTTSQFANWWTVIGKLRAWTGRTKIVWHQEWNEFWSSHVGPNATLAGFDFTEVRPIPTDAEDDDDDDDEDSGEKPGTSVAKDDADREVPKLFGLEVKSSKFLVIVDTSGSMKSPNGPDRMALLKTHTKEFLTALKTGVLYNILTFNSTSDMNASVAAVVGKKTKSLPMLAKMSKQGKLDHPIDKKVESWVDDLTARNQTFVDKAFEEAFAPPKGAPPNWRPPYSHIYFITDGAPSDERGRPLTDVEWLLKKIRGLNARHRVKIQCIGFQGADLGFLTKLQEQNGGGSPTVIKE